jgi:bacterioferritin (cytochrome b1)
VMEEILAKEEEHAEDLKTLIESLSQAEIERPDRKRNENAA